MTDIVDRLLAIRGPRDMFPWPHHPNIPNALLKDAVDEIDRLRNRCKELGEDNQVFEGASQEEYYGDGP